MLISVFMVNFTTSFYMELVCVYTTLCYVFYLNGLISLTLQISICCSSKSTIKLQSQIHEFVCLILIIGIRYANKKNLGEMRIIFSYLNAQAILPARIWKYLHF